MKATSENKQLHDARVVDLVYAADMDGGDSDSGSETGEDSSAEDRQEGLAKQDARSEAVSHVRDLKAALGLFRDNLDLEEPSPGVKARLLETASRQAGGKTWKEMLAGLFTAPLRYPAFGLAVCVLVVCGAVLAVYRSMDKPWGDADEQNPRPVSDVELETRRPRPVAAGEAEKRLRNRWDRSTSPGSEETAAHPTESLDDPFAKREVDKSKEHFAVKAKEKKVATTDHGAKDRVSAPDTETGSGSYAKSDKEKHIRGVPRKDTSSLSGGFLPQKKPRGKGDTQFFKNTWGTSGNRALKRKSTVSRRRQPHDAKQAEKRSSGYDKPAPSARPKKGQQVPAQAQARFNVALYRQGLQAQRKQKHKKAIRLLKRALKAQQAPRHQVVLAWARSEAAVGNLKKAIALLDGIAKQKGEAGRKAAALRKRYAQRRQAREKKQKQTSRTRKKARRRKNPPARPPARK
jgi:hypothetical protein